MFIVDTHTHTHIHNIKYIVSTILSMSGIGYIHIVMQQLLPSISRIFSSSQTGSLYDTLTPYPLLPGPDNHHSTLCLSLF